MPITFKVEPRHVEMFGAQGILAPLYQRQAQKFALGEEERRSQAQFEQMKALTQLRANLEAQLQAADPYRQAQTKETEATAELRGFQLEQAKGEDVATADFARNYAAAPPEKRPEIVRQEFARRGILQGLMPHQFAPPTPTLFMNPETGKLKVFQGNVRLPDGGKQKGVPTARLSLSDRMLRGIRDKYNPKADKDVRRNYSGIKWDAPAMKSLGVERAGVFGVGAGQVGGGRMDWMDNIMQTMATPATAIDSTGMVVPDENEFNRRATVIENFKTALQDEPEGASKEKMRTILRDMQRAMNEALKLSSEEGQLYLSNPQAQPQQSTEEEWSPLNTWTP